MEDQLTLRPATTDDLAGVQRVAQETWRATYAGKIPDEDIEWFLQDAYSLDNLGRALEHLQGSLLVAVVGDELIGYATAGRNRAGEGELFAIYVLPEWQGRGAGRVLWDAACDTLAELGFTTMDVWVLASNDQARRFYERQGAVTFGEREFRVGDGMIPEVGYRVQLGHAE